ncbi:MULTISPECIES: formate/nitrite transporter family protein [Reichenbachiella]|uniref:formate/nitrite transporter family protein n=1 Tax=Reichenbachiella TaxID=156993 RepID=UPI000E6B85A4|nr:MULTISPECIES: formate/nitrite transporter family protein [Reichenbachiella]MBU2913242.1 formate/nitrite transporter family protein [Reichenbachiella agariperforans]RJE74767.1 formate transporter [Reichenbachiella sp. MSK19-1]
MNLFSRKFRPTEEAEPGRPKEVKQILEEQIDMSMKEFNRSSSGLFMSAFTAGLEIGFSVLFMGTVFTMFGDLVSPEVLKIMLAMCYPLGFIFVIIGRSELFTEHTALAILPVLNGSIKLKFIFKLWGLVYSGNLIGGFIFSLLIAKIGPAVGFIDEPVFYHLAHEMTDYHWEVILLSALLAGWMMGLLGWLVTSSQETISRILMIGMVTSIIGMAGLHHCIVGSIEVFSGMITSEDITFMDYLKFQFWATVGNAIGGTVFVAVLKFSHVRFNS